MSHLTTGRSAGGSSMPLRRKRERPPTRHSRELLAGIQRLGFVFCFWSRSFHSSFGRASYLSCSCKKGNRKNTPLALRFSGQGPKSPRLRSCVPPTAHPCADVGIGAIPRAAPSGIAARCRRNAKGTRERRSRTRARAAAQSGALSARATEQIENSSHDVVQGWTVDEANPAPSRRRASQGGPENARRGVRMDAHASAVCTWMYCQPTPGQPRSAGYSDSQEANRNVAPGA